MYNSIDYNANLIYTRYIEPNTWIGVRYSCPVLELFITDRNGVVSYKIVCSFYEPDENIPYTVYDDPPIEEVREFLQYASEITCDAYIRECYNLISEYGLNNINNI